MGERDIWWTAALLIKQHGRKAGELAKLRALDMKGRRTPTVTLKCEAGTEMPVPATPELSGDRTTVLSVSIRQRFDNATAEITGGDPVLSTHFNVNGGANLVHRGGVKVVHLV